MIPMVIAASLAVWFLIAVVIAGLVGAPATVGVVLLVGAAVAAVVAAVIGRRIRKA